MATFLKPFVTPVHLHGADGDPVLLEDPEVLLQGDRPVAVPVHLLNVKTKQNKQTNKNIIDFV